MGIVAVSGANTAAVVHVMQVVVLGIVWLQYRFFNNTSEPARSLSGWP